MVTALSTLAHAGHETREDVERAFATGMAEVEKKESLLPKEQCTLRRFDEALSRLAQTTPQVKKRIMHACAACIGADGKVTAREGELLRAVAAVLGCPMAPGTLSAGDR